MSFIPGYTISYPGRLVRNQPQIIRSCIINISIILTLQFLKSFCLLTAEARSFLNSVGNNLSDNVEFLTKSIFFPAAGQFDGPEDV
jgi:hypothetical protein